MIFPFQDVPKYVILAILNSRIAHWYIKTEADLFRNDYYAFEPMVLNHFPIPDFSKLNQGLISKIESVVKDILSFGGIENVDFFKDHDAVTKIKKLLDWLNLAIYEIYNLNPGEQKVIERY